MKTKNKTKQEEQNQNKEDFVKKQEYDELKEMLQRSHAEFQNFRRRTEEEKNKFVKFSNEELIKKIIPILDNFEIALKHNKENNDFVEGMKLIYGQLIETLEQEGLKRIPTTKFDPKMHEAVIVEETDKEPCMIIEELQKGYMINDKVIRSSKVKISKPKKTKNTEEVDKNE